MVVQLSMAKPCYKQLVWVNDLMFLALFWNVVYYFYMTSVIFTIIFIAKRNQHYTDDPPAYQPPTGSWHNAPPPTYSPPNGGYYGWVPPPTNAFPNAPPGLSSLLSDIKAFQSNQIHFLFVANSVYMTDMPPPYPGINTDYGFKSSGHGRIDFGAQTH